MAPRRPSSSHDDIEANVATSSSSFSITKQKGKSLKWKNINMYITSKKKKSKQQNPEQKEKKEVSKQILNNVSGEALPGELTAILGSSGAGKTSLFNVLSGRARSNGHLHVEAPEIRLGGALVDPSKMKVRRQIAFVAQEDSLNPSSTAREAIRFSARLRHSRSVSDDEIDRMVQMYIQELGLNGCADTIIGHGLRKGLSGGEKKRTSIGVELVVNPSLVLLDEPTSGLDSASAEQLLKVLAQVAASNASVLFTIHQPSTELFEMFDKIILMNGGRVMYAGPIPQISNDFEQRGYAIPQNYNPADWIMKVAQRTPQKELEANGFFSNIEIHDDNNEGEANSITKFKSDEPTATSRVSLLTEVKLLYHRQFLRFVREPAGLLIGLGITTFLTFIYGILYLNVGSRNKADFENLQSINALLNILISTMMSQSNAVLVKIPIDRPLFLREYSTNHYRVLPYALANFSFEAGEQLLITTVQCLIAYYAIGFQMHFGVFLCICYAVGLASTSIATVLGSAFSDVKAVSSTFQLAVVPQFFLSGVFVATNLIPSFVRWAQYLCGLKYAAGLAMINEFRNCEKDGQVARANCDKLLYQNNVSEEDEWWFWMALLGLVFGFRILAAWIIRKKGRIYS